MDNKALGEQLKALRLKNGFSQDKLAETAGVSLRTVQRFENAESTPRMDTVKRLFQIFGKSSDEVLDCAKPEDKGYLLGMNLSGLAFLLIPLFGAVLPIVLWMSRKDKIARVSLLGRDLVNFQLTWSAVYYLGLALNSWINRYMLSSGEVSRSIVMTGFYFSLGIKLAVWTVVIVMIFWNTNRINKGLTARYFPKIRFLR